MSKRYKCVTLGEISNSNGIQTGPFGSQLKAEEYTKHGIPVVMPKDIVHGRLVLDTISQISNEKAKALKKHQIQEGDIIFPRRGDLRRIGVASKENVGWICGTGCLRARLNDNCYPAFLHQYFQLDVVGKWLERNALGQTMLNLNTEIISNLPISLPPLSEQKAIADFLATWDEAIDKTERLTALKKLHFKQLLTDLISMPRDKSKNAKWQKVILGDICTVITSNVDKKTSPNEVPVSLCNYMDVYKNYYITSKLCFMKATASPGEIEKFQLKKYDVLLTKDSETPDDIANSACVLDAPENLLCGYHLAILRPQKHIFGPYLNFALHTPRVRYQFSSQANGATRFGLTMSAYNIVELPLPSFEEQMVIAKILSAVQQEIDLLKQLAEKYKSQKRGLMQKLLTGQWRIKPGVVKTFE